MLTDTFTRTISGGLGSTDSGFPWVIDQGTTTQFSVDGSEAVIQAVAGKAPIAHVGSSLTDSYVQFKTRALGIPTGGSCNMLAALRLADAANYWRAGMQIAAGGGITCYIQRQVANANTAIGSTVSLGTYTANTWYWIYFEIVGVHCKLFVWKDGTAKPSTATVEGDDVPIASSGATASGFVGFRNQTNPGVTTAPNWQIESLTADATSGGGGGGTVVTATPYGLAGGGYRQAAVVDPFRPKTIVFGADVGGIDYSPDLFQTIVPANLGIYGPGLLDRQMASFYADPSTSGRILAMTKGNARESLDHGVTWTTLGGTGLVGGGSHPRGTGRACWYLADGRRVTCYDQSGTGIQIGAAGASPTWTNVTGWPGNGSPPGGIPNPTNLVQCFVWDTSGCWRVSDITAGTPTYTSMTGLSGAYELMYDSVNDLMWAVQGQTVKTLLHPWSASAGSAWTTVYTGDTNFGSVFVETYTDGKTYVLIGGNPYNTSGHQAVVRGVSSTGFLSDSGTWTVQMGWIPDIINGAGQKWALTLADAAQGVDGNSQSFDTTLLTINPDNGKLIGIILGHAGVWMCSDFTLPIITWAPAAHGLGGEICRAVYWDIRDNGYVWGGISDHGAVVSPTGLFDQVTYVRTSNDSKDFVQDPRTFEVFCAYDTGEVIKYPDPTTGDFTEVDMGMGGGGSKKMVTLGLIYDGSGNRVLFSSTKSGTVQRKVGNGTPTTISALGTPVEKHNMFASDHANGLIAYHDKNSSGHIYVSTDFGVTWTSVLSTTTNDDYDGWIFWWKGKLYYTSSSLFREIVGPWTSPTITDLTGTLPANVGMAAAGPNGHVSMIMRATSTLPTPAVYTTTMANLIAHTPNWQLVADTDNFWKNIGQFPLAVSVNGTGGTLVALDGMGIRAPEPLTAKLVDNIVNPPPGNVPDPVFTAGIATGSRTNSTSELFTWQQITGATWYTQLDNDPWVNRGTATSLVVSSLHGSMTHRFRLMAVVGGVPSRIAVRQWDIVGKFSRVKFEVGAENCLVIPIKWTGAAPTATPTDWQTQLDAINAYYAEASWGRFQFAFDLCPIVTITAPSGTINYNTVMTNANAQALAAGYDVNNYLHVIYAPPADPSLIGEDFVVANPSSTQTLVCLVPNGLDPSYIYGINALCHELGHSLGFSHANALDCTGVPFSPTVMAAAEADSSGGSGNIEYGNTTSTMGRGQRAAWVSLGVSNVKVTIPQQESVLGKRFKGQRFNHQLYTLLPTAGINNAFDAGYTRVYLNSDAHDSSSGTKLPIPWADVASGLWDTVLTSAATAMAADTTRFTSINPFIFSFHHEQTVNTTGQPGFTACGTPQDYINAFRHVRGLWDAAGATVRKADGTPNGGNTIFAFVPTDNSLRPGRARVDGGGLAWTGDVLDPDKGSSPAPTGTTYYELCGCDYYNRTASGALNDGNNPSVILNALNAFALARGKQWVIGELACDDAPNVAAGQKAAWIASLQSLIKSYGSGPGSCYALYWSDFDNGTVDGGIPAYYNFDSSPDALAAAQTLFNDPWFSGMGGFV